ncbi:proton glutamate symport protein [Pedobacter sp. CG_S7]|uniref:dicarboxylate/amino acid:cation symporter n=1 Tax=Pedobacter sp. CG_S7 TaxID=3143930 RepID=UPI0033951462
MKKIKMHWQIAIGIILGVLFGVLLIQFNWGNQFILDWIKPFGTIFINLLKLIAIPLIIVSLIKGVTDLKDINKLSKMGIKTIGIYLLTTVLAITIGLILVNTIKPGRFISAQTRTEMLSTFGQNTNEKIEQASSAKTHGPLQVLVDIVPENLMYSASYNGNMLQIIFFTLLFGISMVLLPEVKTVHLKKMFEGANDVIMKIVDIIMLFAPYGVFALMASLIAESPSADIFKALATYGFTVILGLVLLVYLIYPFLLKFWGGANPILFYKNLAPAQLVAFTTSSSAATLPITMECVEEKIGVHKEVSSFVLPIGATINMDGTSLYQGVAAVFIAQVLGYDLSLMQQLSILMTATLASIGTAAVPGAGILMLVIVLESININPAGIALIIAVDRPLDMFRTVTNVSGDAMVAVVINKISGNSLTPKTSE